MKMLKYSMPLLVGIALFLGACTTTKRTVHNTLYSVESSTTAAYDTYLYGVIRGNFKTNDVPVVSQNYDRFQIGMRVAIVAAQYNMTNLAPHDVIHLAEVVVHSILEAKAR